MYFDILKTVANWTKVFPAVVHNLIPCVQTPNKEAPKVAHPLVLHPLEALLYLTAVQQGHLQFGNGFLHIMPVALP